MHHWSGTGKVGDAPGFAGLRGYRGAHEHAACSLLTSAACACHGQHGSGSLKGFIVFGGRGWDTGGIEGSGYPEVLDGGRGWLALCPAAGSPYLPGLHEKASLHCCQQPRAAGG